MKNQNWGMVDKLIYEAYKDKCLYNTEKFKKQIKEDFGYSPSSDLYREIINYQVKKYGRQLDFQSREEVKNFFNKSKSQRENLKIRIDNKRKTERYEERIENGIREKNSKC